MILIYSNALHRSTRCRVNRQAVNWIISQLVDCAGVQCLPAQTNIPWIFSIFLIAHVCPKWVFSRSNVYSVAKYKINALANRASERPTQVQDQNRQQLKKRANSSAGRTKRVVVFSHHVLSLAVDRMLCRHDVAYNSQITFLVSWFQWSPFDKHVANVWASDYQQLAFVLWLSRFS